MCLRAKTKIKDTALEESKAKEKESDRLMKKQVYKESLVETGRTNV